MADIACRRCEEGLWRCTICDGTNPEGINPKLCQDCAAWNDITHVLFCKQDDYKDINPLIFSGLTSGGGYESYENAGLSSRLEDLVFHPRDYFSPRNNCMMCALLDDALQEYVGHQVDAQFAVWRPFPWTQNKPLRRDSNIHPDNDRDTTAMTEKCILPMCVSTRSSPSGVPTYKPLFLKLTLHYGNFGFDLVNVSRWDDRHISTKDITTWLTHCESQHGDMCNNPSMTTSLPSSLYLIDTKQKCIVRVSAPPACGYCALSYVWSAATGSTNKTLQLELGNIQELEQPGALTEEKLPEVVFDAIQLCADLGQRYLWVDRLCIVQDDKLSKAEQINAMAAIYLSAKLTIVALGQDDKYGLFGVSNRPRHSGLDNLAWHVGIDNDYLSFTPLFMHSTVNLSTWNTRAWTYQERICSRRHLFIAENHIYFSCFHEHHSGWEYRPNRHNYGFETGFRFSSDEPYLNTWNSQVYTYTTAVEDYTKRKLSFNKDILNAFAGITSVLSARLDSNFLFGLSESFFLNSLLWGHGGPGTPRAGVTGIPSWSWAAWNGPILYHSSGDPYPSLIEGYHPTNECRLGNLATFYFSDAVHGVRPLNEHRLWFPGPGNRGSSVSVLVKTGEYVSNLEDSSSDIWRQYAHNPWEAAARGAIPQAASTLAATVPNSIVFNTTSKSLVLVRDRFELDGAFAVFKIMNKQGEVIGETMSICYEEADRIFSHSQEYPVIVLGACSQVRGSVLGLYVMIIQREQHISRRLALGVVDPQSWTKLQPVWETIILA